MENDLMVSVCCVVYNHRDFIGHALHSFVQQETNFKFEVLVHDDASTDGSAEIISAYSKRFPSIVKPILQSENQWMRNNRNPLIYELFPRARGKYIALCEGDDLWTDSTKLQKQVDLMESDDSITICFHNFLEGQQVEEAKAQPKYGTGYVDMINAITHTIGHTSTMLFRSNVELPLQLILKSPMGDFPIKLHCLSKGKGFYIDEVMSFYRRHQNSVYNPLGAIEKFQDIISTHKQYRKNFARNRFDLPRIDQAYRVTADKIFLTSLASRKYSKAISALSFYIRVNPFRNVPRFIFHILRLKKIPYPSPIIELQ